MVVVVVVVVVEVVEVVVVIHVDAYCSKCYMGCHESSCSPVL